MSPNRGITSPIAPILHRQVELNELHVRLRRRQSFVMHGEGGVGKTLLLRAVLRDFPDVLYCEDATGGHAIFRSLALALLRARDPYVTDACRRAGEAVLKRKSVLALRGLVTSALRAGWYQVALDHVQRTSAGLAADVRELFYRADTPVIAVARSAHMEELGFLIGFFALQTDQMEIGPFPADVASEFAEHVADRTGFYAINREEVLKRIVKLSKGIPGTIVELVRMAMMPRYRTSGHVKLTPLYIDFRLGWHAAHAF
jgi:hypothetical protein